jgi:anti-sigma regulatory factor (Ser/Thr protein kinase)
MEQATLTALSEVGRARKLVHRAMEDRDGEARDASVLLTSEVVTNALVHAGGSVEVHVTLSPSTVRVEVRDTSRRAPLRRNAHEDATNGRGLELVELLAARWGVDPSPEGKTVWFELERPKAPAGEVRAMRARKRSVVPTPGCTMLVLPSPRVAV